MSRRLDRAHAAAAETLLAWRRTALQLAVGAVVATRLVVREFGEWVVVAGFLGAAVALAVHASATRAYAEATGTPGEITPSGMTVLARPHARLWPMTVGAVVLGAIALVWTWSA